MADLPKYELYAIRYATRASKRSENFIGGDPHDGPMPLDYYVWVAMGPDRNYVIDTGFSAEIAAKRGRDYLRCPIQSLKLVGLEPEKVKDVILTHLHYDHVGNFEKLPEATFHLQESELHYAVGRYMRYKKLQHSYEIEDVVGMVRANYAGRVNFYDGMAELSPGITIHPAPGHSAGLQFVRVHTRRGWIVLASDVTHFYENMEAYKPYVTAFHIGGMLEGFDKLRAAAASADHIIPGHDPIVMQRYNPPRVDLDGIVVRLDDPPRASRKA
jgi:glyoxylase-like metal-dependent hydrolase (beta-lactamase superfamily II)